MKLRVGLLACVLVAWSQAAAAGEAPSAARIDIPNAVVIQEGVLGGGQPTPDQLRAAAAAGYRTIVNTRGSGELADFAEEEALVRSLGMNYVFIAIGAGEPVDAAKARSLAALIADPEALPAMVHCRSGNRVGQLFAAKAFVVDGLAPEAALAAGTAAGMRHVPAELEALMQGGAAP